MAQQSVTRVTGRRSGCHHKTFQLVIANINVAAPAHARCRADSHARHAVLTRPFGTRERVPGTRTLLFPLSAGWRTTVVVSAVTGRRGGGQCRCFFVNRYGSRFLFIIIRSLCRLNLFFPLSKKRGRESITHFWLQVFAGEVNARCSIYVYWILNRIFATLVTREFQIYSITFQYCII